MPKWLQSKSAGIQKRCHTLLAECIWFQMARRCMPHRADSSRFTIRRFTIESGGIDKLQKMITTILDFPLDGTTSAQLELKALSGMMEKASNTRAGEDELARSATIKSIYDNGYQVPLHTLSIRDDSKQLMLGSIQHHTPGSLVKGEKGREVEQTQRDCLMAASDKAIEMMFSTFNNESFSCLAGMDSFPGHAKGDWITGWSKFRTALWTNVTVAGGDNGGAEYRSSKSGKGHDAGGVSGGPISKHTPFLQSLGPDVINGFVSFMQQEVKAYTFVF